MPRYQTTRDRPVRTRGWYQEGPLAWTLGLVLGGGPGIFPPEPLGQKEEVLRSQCIFSVASFLCTWHVS